MHTPLHHHIRPGIVHFMAFPATIKGEGPILETVRQILTDDYFQVLEISWIKDPAVRAEVKAMIESSGVEAKYGAQPRLLTQKLDLNHADESTRLRAVAEIKAAIDEAAEMGIHDVGLLSGADVAPAERPAAMERLEKSLVECCHHAALHGCNLVLEVFDRDVDKKALIGPVDTALEIATRVKSATSNFGLMVDLSHIPLLGESPEQALIPVKDHIAHIHIGNAYFDQTSDPAWGDQHPRFGYPGGANDVTEIVAFLRVLFQIGYLKADGSSRGNVSFEIKPLPGEDATVMIAAAKRKLGAAWAQLSI
jgi:sugar phosphate isomerase/epimerase